MDRRQRWRLVLVLGSLIAIGPLTIDIYLPAFPAIAADLQAGSTAVQLTLTGTLIGLAGGRLEQPGRRTATRCWPGPPSGRTGRRRAR